LSLISDGDDWQALSIGHPMVEMTAVVENAAGIYVRPSSIIVEEVAEYPGEIRVVSTKGETNLRSIVKLLFLSLEHGAELSISVSGPNEEAFCQKIVDLFQRNYDFQTHAE